MLYMHPVKAQSDIRLALETYGIRVLSLDHEDEVAKILRIVRALDLDPGTITLFVRIQTKGHAAYELSKKFGAAPAHAVELLQRCHRIGFKIGICFHVGSQIEDPDTYERALASADWVRNRADVPLAGLDVGGGFPAEYGHDPRRRKKRDAGLRRDHDAADDPTSEEWGFRRHAARRRARPRHRRARLFADRPGAAAERASGSTSMTASGRRCRIPGPARSPCRPASFPIPRASSRNGDPAKIGAFKVCGATCDCVDILSRPFWLPETVDTGDWIEIGHIGAYSLSLRTRFNGFYPDTFVEVATPFDEGEAAEGYASLETMAD